MEVGFSKINPDWRDDVLPGLAVSAVARRPNAQEIYHRVKDAQVEASDVNTQTLSSQLLRVQVQPPRS